MYNLKNANGTFKGNIGECMFKITRRNLFLMRFHSMKKVFEFFYGRLNKDQHIFIRNNWYSIDGIELIGNKITLFEIKTRNRYDFPINFKPKASKSTLSLYTTASYLGFDVKIAYVWLEKDWNYSIEIKDFSSNHFYVDTIKKYDKLN